MKYVVLNSKLLMFTLVLSIYSNIFAQNIDSLKYHNQYDENNKIGLQIYLVNGISVSLIKQYSNSDFFRFHIDLYGNIDNSEGDRNWINKSQYDTTDYYDKEDNNRNSQDIFLSLEYLSSLYNTKIIKFYIGGGPIIGFTRYNQDVENKRDDENTSFSHQSYRRSISAGLLGILGFESKIIKNISLFGEYQINLSHYWNKEIWNHKSDITESNSDFTSKSIRLYLNRIKLGLSVYF